MLKEIEENIKNNSTNSKKILAELNKIGKINENFSYHFLINLLDHKVRDIRLEVIKHLGKFSNEEIENILISHYKNETDSMVKRECISSLGRQRNENQIDFLISVLSDKDPKIVLQAIRALLVFKKKK